MTQHTRICFLLMAFVQASAGLRWTSSGAIANGTTIPACSEQDVTLAWSYTPNAEEHLMNVEWYFTRAGGNATLLATEVMGNFFATPTATQRLQFLPNAGIRLQNVATEHAGNYSVHVNLNLHGSVVTDVQTAVVQVSDGSLTTDGQLHVRMLPEAVYDNSTQQFHVQLACGNFKPVWSYRVSVVWKTASDETVPSTSYDNGRFLLSVPNPVTSGEYTCAIDNTSPASLCVQSDSPLNRGASVSVDGTDVRFTLMATNMKSMQTAVDTLQKQMVSMETKHQQDMAVLKQQMQDSMARLTSKLGQQVYFYAVPSSEKLNNDRPLFDRVVHNVGSGYSSYTGRFTAPVSGLYLFMVTADSSRSSLHVKVTLHVSNGEYVSALGIANASGSNQLVVHLSAGEFAYVSLDHAPLETANDSSFVGVLIQADV